MARVTFDLRGPGSLDDADARMLAAWLEREEAEGDASTLAAKIRAALESDPKRRKSVAMDASERDALLHVLKAALDGGNLNGDLRWLQQSLLE